jgi:hypothetical protein
MPYWPATAPCASGANITRMFRRSGAQAAAATATADDARRERKDVVASVPS